MFDVWLGLNHVRRLHEERRQKADEFQQLEDRLRLIFSRFYRILITEH